MKKILLILLVSLAGFVSAESWDVTVNSSVSLVIVPSHTTRARAWTAQTYQYGAKVQYGGNVYWTFEGGTSTTNPVSGDAVDWIQIPRRGWSHIWITGDLNATTYIALGAEATVDEGYILDGARSRVHLPEDFKKSVEAITASGTADIRIMAF